MPCPFFPLFTKRNSLGSEGGVLEAQQQHQWPKVIAFALQIIYRETETDAESGEMSAAEIPTFVLL